MIAFLEGKYKINVEWVATIRNQTVYYDENGNEIDGMSVFINKIMPTRKEDKEFEVSEAD